MTKELTLNCEVVGIEDTGTCEMLKLFVPDDGNPAWGDDFDHEEIEIRIPRTMLDVKVRDKISITVAVQEPVEA